MDTIKNNIQHFIDVGKYFKERLLCIITIIIITSCIIVIFLKFSIIVEPENVECQQIIFCNISLDNWGILLTIIGLIGTAIWSMYQYTKSKNLNQQEKAAKVANDFANNIVERLGLISSTLTNIEKYNTLLEKINVDDLNNFNTYEIIKSSNDKYIFDKFNILLHSSQMQKKYEQLLLNRYNSDESKMFDSNFIILIQNTLNKLEAICMNISSNAAGSQYIYPSLHQVFLRNIYILSPFISENNITGVDKYYINIIQVYNLWNTEYNKELYKFNKSQEKLKKLKEKQEKEIQKILKKNPRTV